MLHWEQIHEGRLLHGYDGHAKLPVCGDKDSERTATDRFPRTTYIGPTPPPPELVCEPCRLWERNNDPIFLAGRAHGLSVAAGLCAAISSTFADACDTGQALGADQCADQIRALLSLLVSNPEPSDAALAGRPTCCICGKGATNGMGQADPKDPRVAVLVSFCEEHRPTVEGPSA